MKNNIMLVFDMDGTIYDLYNVDNWLVKLRSEQSIAYYEGKPLYNMEDLRNLLLTLKEKGVKIAVTTWGAKDATTAYNRKTEKAKKAWLASVRFPFDLFTLQPYGTPKRLATSAIGGTQILIDDNEEVRKEWGETETINATKNIIEEIKKFFGMV